MSISLREITPENFSEVIHLDVAENQRGFIASNVKSIAQAKIYPTAVPLAVYYDEELVGFVMYALDTDDNRYYLVRLMIDEKHQSKGYGKAATLKVIEQMKEIDGCKAIYLSFVPENKGAEKLYSSIGFERTGETNDSGEIVMRFELKEINNQQLTPNN